MPLCLQAGRQGGAGRCGVVRQGDEAGGGRRQVAGGGSGGGGECTHLTVDTAPPTRRAFSSR